MDTYIKMCEEAEEIQKLFNPEGHNHLYASGCIFTDWDRDAKKYDKYTEYGHQFICLRDGYLWHCNWIPTEEQLQKIAMELPSLQGRVMQPFWELVDQFNYFIFGDETRKYVSQFNSFKEFWLAFVMKEKYHKIWGGKTWIKST